MLFMYNAATIIYLTIVALHQIYAIKFRLEMIT